MLGTFTVSLFLKAKFERVFKGGLAHIVQDEIWVLFVDGLTLNEVFDLLSILAHVNHLLYKGFFPSEEEVFETLCVLVAAQGFLHREGLLHFASALFSLRQWLYVIFLHEP